MGNTGRAQARALGNPIEKSNRAIEQSRRGEQVCLPQCVTLAKKGSVPGHPWGTSLVERIGSGPHGEKMQALPTALVLPVSWPGHPLQQPFTQSLPPLPPPAHSASQTSPHHSQSFDPSEISSIQPFDLQSGNFIRFKQIIERGQFSK